MHCALGVINPCAGILLVNRTGSDRDIAYNARCNRMTSDMIIKPKKNAHVYSASMIKKAHELCFVQLQVSKA